MPVALPEAGYAPKYRRRHDITAGLMLAGLLVPQGIAYAGIAGVPPQHGLYAAAIGLLVYALLGSARHTVVSPTSSAAAILATAVFPLAGSDTARYAAFASALTILVGLFFVGGAVLRLGAISDFVSKPVLKGFMFGLGMTIAVKQAASLAGVQGVHGDFFEAARGLLASAGQTRQFTLAVGASALAVLFVAAARAPRLPAGLLVLAGGIAASAWFDFQGYGVAVVGLIDGGLPQPRLPGVGWEQGILLSQAAAGIALVAFSEALGTGRNYAVKHGYTIRPNRELVALGVSNLASGILQGIPVGIGASASAVNERSGARSQLSSVTASGVVVLTLLFLMPVFQSLPQAVLAAIVIHAVSGLFDVSEMRRYARIKRGIVPALTALLGVLAFGVLRGMLLAMAVNIVLLLKRLATPGLLVLGRIPGTRTYVDLEQYPDAERIPGLLLVRVDGMVFFGNVEHLLSGLRELIAESGSSLKSVMLGCDALFDIDVAGLDMLAQLHDDCALRGVELTLTRVGDRLRALLERAGLEERLNPDRLFYSQKEAVDDFVRRHSEGNANIPEGSA